jgi:hypothetical protein
MPRNCAPETHDKQIRYLVTFSDGGSGRRYRDESLEIGTELDDDGGPAATDRAGAAAAAPGGFGYRRLTQGWAG